MEIHWPEMAQEIGSGESLEAGRLRGTTIRLGAQESGWRGVAVALRDGLGLRVADAEVDAEWMRSGCGVDCRANETAVARWKVLAASTAPVAVSHPLSCSASASLAKFVVTSIRRRRRRRWTRWTRWTRDDSILFSGFSYLLTLLQMPKKEKGVGREGK